MKTLVFKELLNNLNDLTDAERRTLTLALQRVGGEEKALEMIEGRFISQDCCPHCDPTEYHRHGHAHHLQRYRCKACKKTFNALTGTPLARLRNKKQWFNYLNALSASKTVRACAKLSSIHRNTAFRWRHRFLSGVTKDLPSDLGGIVEVDETFILASEKRQQKIGSVASW